MEHISHSDANTARKIILCAEADIAPGTMQEVTAEGVTFLIVRASDGAMIVIPPTCPHMLASLSEGFFDGVLLTCAKHLWQWSACDGQMTGLAEKPLLLYDYVIEDGKLIVQFDQRLEYEYS